MNGNAPFSKPFFTSKVGGLNRLDWVGMLRFRHIAYNESENKDFAFPRDTYVYGYRISFFDLDKFKRQMADGRSEVTIMGKLFEEEFLQVTECLKKSSSVKRIFRKLL